MAVELTITQEELADKLGGLASDPEFAAAHVFEELYAERCAQTASG